MPDHDELLRLRNRVHDQILPELAATRHELAEYKRRHERLEALVERIDRQVGEIVRGEEIATRVAVQLERRRGFEWTVLRTAGAALGAAILLASALVNTLQALGVIG